VFAKVMLWGLNLSLSGCVMFIQEEYELIKLIVLSIKVLIFR